MKCPPLTGPWRLPLRLLPSLPGGEHLPVQELSGHELGRAVKCTWGRGWGAGQGAWPGDTSACSGLTQRVVIRAPMTGGGGQIPSLATGLPCSTSPAKPWCQWTQQPLPLAGRVGRGKGAAGSAGPWGCSLGLCARVGWGHALAEELGVSAYPGGSVSTQPHRPLAACSGEALGQLLL